MSTQTYAPYRDCYIEVHVTPSNCRAFGGISRRYRVSWQVASTRHPECDLVSFPEQLEFLSEEQASRYGESRAHTFIDSVLSTPSNRRMARDSSESADEAPAG
ncbi:hypothetical protein LMG28727_02137 [Paraburkholderia kirstenboschensis]|uniref:hypothetical protein n=1 Tax=Paraburkholderia kirstenboschensis TaxID=1245436 RepID=UPI000AED2FFC|nr:hypothetical protein [Paraburkholderia kirstenboschensis]CAD6526233.1 hypothetical protein LMG28727_02137 [Paraburkholderia kirstenboschensis]